MLVLDVRLDCRILPSICYFRVVPLDVRLFVLLLLNALLFDNEIALSRSHIIPQDDATFFDLAAKNGGQAKRKDKC